ncbi:MAG TPA: efflux RND transporter periplasmic adaptor subunit [Phycisphaerae bacterium]|nr:efflux RND transporter periplasmic adaptor subunit [Phycisphaerae bacterium]
MKHDQARAHGRVAITMVAVVAALSVGVAAGIWFQTRRSSTETEAAKPKTWYTCGMHPQVRQDHPGNCPICQMKLTPVREQETVEQVKGTRKVVYWRAPMNPAEIYDRPGKSAMGMDLVPVYEDELAGGGKIKIDPVLRQNMGIRTAEVVRGPLRKTIRAVAYVDYDETTLAEVTTKVGGWVEKLYVDQTGQQIHQGDPLFELYSPALYTAQEEYLAATRSLHALERSTSTIAREDARRLIEAARTKLEYFDISEEQVDRLAATGQITKALVIRSPATGIVSRKNVVQGQRIEPGTVCYQIADLSTVWVKAKIYEQDLPYVRLGQEVLMQLAYEPGVRYTGRITYVYPYLEAETREVPIRAEFHNPGYLLKPGMYASVEIDSLLKEDAILVPDSAVIQTGTRQLVFVDEGDGTFQPRKVSVGLRSGDNQFEVLSGLAGAERVVVSGQFMLDSESRLREATMKAVEPGQATAEFGVVEWRPSTPREQGVSTQPTAGRTYWTCPMPEHAGVLYEQPGQCPICGMATVPVAQTAGKRLPGPVKYWTCPMPEHNSVHEDAPGKCPLCSMTLIPVREPSEQPERRGPEPAELPDLYTCPMEEDVDVTTDQPGRCPKCGMALVPIEQVGHAAKAIQVYRDKVSADNKAARPDMDHAPEHQHDHTGGHQ